ncbi:MAG: ATP-binding protein [Bacteroidales bacterium]
MKNLTLYLFKINRWVSAFSAVIVILISALALAGWFSGNEYLKTLSPGSVSMKFNTVVSFILTGLSMLLLINYKSGKISGKFMSGMVYIALAIGVITVLQYFFGVNLYIDELFLKDIPDAAHTSSPGRMSIYTAGGFIICSIAIILYKQNEDRYIIVAQVLSVFLFLLSLLPLLGYLYGSSELYSLSGITKMALNTSVSFFILSMGLIFMRPSGGILEITTYDTIGGHLARRLIPLSLLISVFPIWVSLIFNKNTHLSTIAVIYIGTILLIVFLIVFIWRFLLSLNIMERNRAKAQKESKGWQDLMQYIIQYDPNAIGVMDKEFRYIFVSERFLNDYGITENSVIGKSHYEIFPEIPQRWKEVHQRVLEGEVISADEDSFIRESGRIEYNRWECRPWYDSDGLVGGMILYSEVITKRKEMESEKERLNEQLFKLVSAIKELSTAHTESGVHKIVASAARILANAKGSAFVKRDGEYCWDFNYTPTVNEVRLLQTLADAASIALKNIELLSDLENRVKDRTARLESANRELEAFSYSVSHDLRAPLRAIDGFTRILTEDHSGVLGEDGLRVCKIIRENTHKMGQLIDDLLSFSRLSRADIQKSEVDMGTMANSVFHELTTPDMRRKISFKVDDLLFAYGDATMLRQVWVNLISNAIKFSSKNEISQIEINCVVNENILIYCIKDNGVGFDMRYYGKMFGVFQRLHSIQDFEGTGVGLAIVQRVIHRHGGEVRAEGEVGKGASFTFTLPLNNNL